MSRGPFQPLPFFDSVIYGRWGKENPDHKLSKSGTRFHGYTSC